MNQKVINIYSGKGSILSNFSPHDLYFSGEYYKTAEHCYHFQRYKDSKIIQEIRNSQTPEEAWKISQKYKVFQKKAFENKKVSIMKEILLEKLLQHEEVREFLMKSGDSILEKQFDEDIF